jgi:hypothetical protein
MKQYTYLMYDGNLYKIGKSKNPLTRLNQLKTSNPNLEIICFGNGIEEENLHSIYCKNRVQGEWFNLNNNQIIEIKNLIEQKKDNLFNNVKIENKYIDIKQAALLVGKSANTIRRLALELKGNESKFIKLQLMPNNTEKILIDRLFLKNKYKPKQLINNNHNELILFLKNQIEIKDRQIQQLNNLLKIN